MVHGVVRRPTEDCDLWLVRVSLHLYRLASRLQLFYGKAASRSVKFCQTVHHGDGIRVATTTDEVSR